MRSGFLFTKFTMHLFENQILDVDHLSSDDASDLEKQVYQAFLSKEDNVFSEIRSELTSDHANGLSGSEQMR